MEGRLLAVGFLAFILSFPSFAEVEKPQEEEPQEEITVAAPSAKKRIRSAEYRELRPIIAAAKIGIISGTLGTGLAAGFNIDSEKTIEVFTFNYTTNVYEYPNIDSPYYYRRSEAIGLEFKHFIGNSLFYGLGLVYDRKSYNFYDLVSRDLNSLGSAVVKVDTLLAEVFFGNTWELGHFHLGCDWGGGVLPLATLASSNSSDLAKSDIKSAIEISKKDAKKPAYFSLRLHFGANF